MLNEIGSNLAVVKSLAKTAKRSRQIGKDEPISLLYDQSIKKTRALQEGARIVLKAGVILQRRRYLPGCGDPLQVKGRRKPGCTRLMIINKCPCLFLLISQDPIRDLKHQIAKGRLASHLPPFTESLQQPRDLTEMAVIAKTMPGKTKAPVQPFFVHALLRFFGPPCQSKHSLTPAVIL